MKLLSGLVLLLQLMSNSNEVATNISPSSHAMNKGCGPEDERLERWTKITGAGDGIGERTTIGGMDYGTVADGGGENGWSTGRMGTGVTNGQGVNGSTVTVTPKPSITRAHRYSTQAMTERFSENGSEPDPASTKYHSVTGDGKGSTGRTVTTMNGNSGIDRQRTTPVQSSSTESTVKGRFDRYSTRSFTSGTKSESGTESKELTEEYRTEIGTTRLGTGSTGVPDNGRTTSTPVKDPTVSTREPKRSSHGSTTNGPDSVSHPLQEKHTLIMDIDPRFSQTKTTRKNGVNPTKLSTAGSDSVSHPHQEKQTIFIESDPRATQTKAVSKIGVNPTERTETAKSSKGSESSGGTKTTLTTRSLPHNGDGQIEIEEKTEKPMTGPNESTAGTEPVDERTTVAGTSPVNESKPVCPPEYVRGKGACLRLTFGVTYDRQYDSCTLSEEYANMLDSNEMADQREAMIALIKEWQSEEILLFSNAHKSQQLRQTKQVRIVYASVTGLILKNASVLQNENVHGVASICQIPQFGQPATCPLKTIHARTNSTLVPKTAMDDNMAPGSYMDFSCPREKAHVVFSVGCATNGDTMPHLSVIEHKCNLTTQAPPRPKYSSGPVSSCSSCHPYGTESCDPEGNSAYVCRCKAGWTEKECWRSPDLCANNSCPVDSVCRNEIDRYVCDCKTRECTKQMRWAGRTQAALDVHDAAVKVHTTGSAGTLWWKLVTKVFIGGESPTPQDGYQDLRAMFISIAGILLVLYGRPDTLGTSDIQSRLYGSAILGFLSMANVLQWMESRNVLQVVFGKSINRWQKENNKDEMTTDPSRVGRVLLVVFVGTVALLGHFWVSVATPWSSTGTFGEGISMTWIILNVQLVVSLHASYMAAQAAALHRERILLRIRLERKWEFSEKRQRIRMCLRNLSFATVAPITQFMYVATTLISNDLQIEVSLFFSIVSSVVNVLQFVITTKWCTYLIELGMVVCPSFVPAWNEISGLNRDETIAKIRETTVGKRLTIESDEEARARMLKEERAKIEKRRKELLMKYPGLPNHFLPHVPLDGPESCNTFNYNRGKKGYLSLTKRTKLWKHWTELYLNERLTKNSYFAMIEVEYEALNETEFRKEEFGPVTIADLNTAVLEWKMTIEHQDTISLTLVQDTRPHVRFALVDERMDEETRRRTTLVGASQPVGWRTPSRDDLIGKMLKFQKPRLPEKLEEFTVPIWNEYGWTEPTRVVLSPPILTESQVAEAEEELKRSKLHDRWNRSYDDDEFIIAVTAVYPAFLKEFEPIYPAYPEGRGKTHSLNPRKQGSVDERFYNILHPLFIGPLFPENYSVVGPFERRLKFEVHFEVLRERRRQHYTAQMQIGVCAAQTRQLLRRGGLDGVIQMIWSLFF